MSRVRRSLVSRLRANDFAWRYLFNAGPTLSYRVRSQRRNPHLEGYIATLSRDGVVAMPVAELGGGTDLLGELQREAEGRTLGGSYVEKDYLRYLLGETPKLDLTSPFARFALHRDVRAVVNGYLGMYAQLRFYNLWATPPVASPPAASQLWHRDRDDRMLVKGFLYLRDVDPGSGPFRFAKGTHPKGDIRRDAPAHLEGHIPRSTDAQIASILLPDRMTSICGPAGTLILADTRGYHCGGLATERERLLFTFMYTSRASGTREWFDRSESVTCADPNERFAIGAGRRGPAWPRSRR